MRLEDYNEALKELAAKTSDRLTERVMVVGATSLLGQIHERVFRDGLDSSGNEIGEYSTKPYYAGREQFVKKGAFKPVGKNGGAGNIKIKYTDVGTRTTKSKVIKANGQDRRSMYLKEGYKEFREVQGRDATNVNLQMRGDLKLSLTLQVVEKDVVIGFNDTGESAKRKWLERHFKNRIGTIFPATREEIQNYSKTIIDELRVVEHQIINEI